MKTVAHNRLCCIAVERVWTGVVQVQAKAIINMALLKKSTRDRVLRGFNRGYVAQTTGLAYELFHVLCSASGIPINAIGKNLAIITLERPHAIELEKEIEAMFKIANPKPAGYRYGTRRKRSESNPDWDTLRFGRFHGMTQQGFLNILDKYPRAAGDPAKVDAVRKMVNDGVSFESTLKYVGDK